MISACLLLSAILIPEAVYAKDVSDLFNERQDSQFGPINLRQTNGATQSINNVQVNQDGEKQFLERDVKEKINQVSAEKTAGQELNLQQRRSVEQETKEKAKIVDGVLVDPESFMDMDGDGVQDPFENTIVGRFYKLADINQDKIVDKEEIKKYWDDHIAMKEWYDKYRPGETFDATQWQLVDGTWTARIVFIKKMDGGEFDGFNPKDLFDTGEEIVFTVEYSDLGGFAFVSDQGTHYESIQDAMGDYYVKLGNVLYRIQEFGLSLPPDFNGDGKSDEFDYQILRKSDLNDDGKVDAREADILSWWLQFRASGKGDVNLDGMLDLTDRTILWIRLELQTIGYINDEMMRKADEDGSGRSDEYDLFLWGHAMRQGDFNEDKCLDFNDLDLLYMTIKAGEYNEWYDLNRDMVLDWQDEEDWRRILDYTDLDGDGIATVYALYQGMVVQSDEQLLLSCIRKGDLELLLEEWGGLFANGDVNGDGIEDAEDAEIVEYYLKFLPRGDFNGNGDLDQDDLCILESRIQMIQTNPHRQISLTVNRLYGYDFDMNGTLDMRDIDLAGRFGNQLESSVRPITTGKYTAAHLNDIDARSFISGRNSKFFSNSLAFQYENPITSTGGHLLNIRESFGKDGLGGQTLGVSLKDNVNGEPLFSEAIDLHLEKTIHAVYVKRSGSRLSEDFESADIDSALEKSKEDINTAFDALEKPGEETGELVELANGLIDEAASKTYDADLKEEVKEFADTVKLVLAYTAIGIDPEAIRRLFTSLSGSCQKARAACEDALMQGYYSPLYELLIDNFTLSLWWQGQELSPSVFFNNDKKKLVEFALEKISSSKPESEELMKKRDEILILKETLYQSRLQPAFSAYQQEIRSALLHFNKEAEKILGSFTGASLNDGERVVDAAFVLPQAESSR